MPKEPKRRPPSALGRVLRVYRETHDFTQEQLAALLHVEPRTLRRWENGETILTNVHELKQIADRLGVAYEHLGVATSLYNLLPIEQINGTVERVWSLINEAHINDARAIAENLVKEVSHEIKIDDMVFVSALARAYHAAAHAASLNSRTDEIAAAIYYYQQVEYFARILNDDTLLNISLAYQGDMQRRKGNIARAIEYLEGARDTTPQADASARGNAVQLLGRAYLTAKRVGDFEYAMREAEKIAHAVDEKRNNSTGKQYNLITVYEEYAKGYGILGRVQQALDYVNLAEGIKLPTKSTEILLKIARAEILIHSGDVRNGEPLAIEAALYSREHGHYRRLERIYALKRFLNQQILKYGKVEMALSEALEGLIEY